MYFLLFYQKLNVESMISLGIITIIFGIATMGMLQSSGTLISYFRLVAATFCDFQNIILSNRCGTGPYGVGILLHLHNIAHQLVFRAG